MATLKELIGDKTRGDGRKFFQLGWEKNEWFEPYYLDRYKIWHGLDNDHESISFCFKYYNSWQEWTPPKETKKVKLYSPIGLKDNGKIYTIGQYANDKSVFNSGSDKIVGWHEIEVEVDE